MHRRQGEHRVFGSAALYFAALKTRGENPMKLSARDQLAGRGSEIRRGEAIATA
ncbi:MAG: hypothetical protein ACR2GZ_04720 [Solirubrobacteraceae bacterium]